MVKDGDEVKKDQVIFSWDPYTNPIIADVTGEVRFVDLVEEESVSEELDELTGLRQRVVIEDREKKLHPHIEIWQTKGGKEKRIRDFVIPVGAQLIVDDGAEIAAGTIIAKISREAYKTRDITGGLPRVAELFEARRPKDPATISEVDGIVRFGEIKRGKREIFVQPLKPDGAPDDSQEAQLYEVAAGKHLRVHEGDRVRAGDRLSEGPVNPHDILRIKGPRAVQEYLLNEVQEVYRLQGVKINDKHIGVIVRQMLQKVRVLDPGAGDSEFLEGENVDKAGVPRRERPREEEEAEAGQQRAAAARHHEGESHDAVVHLGGELPGDHARAHRRGDPRSQGQPPRPQGEHHHRASHPGRDGHVPVPGSGHGRRGAADAGDAAGTRGVQRVGGNADGGGDSVAVRGAAGGGDITAGQLRADGCRTKVSSQQLSVTQVVGQGRRDRSVREMFSALDRSRRRCRRTSVTGNSPTRHFDLAAASG